MKAISPNRIELSPKLIIAGIGRRFSASDSDQIFQLWQVFISQMHTIPHAVPEITYGVCSEFSPTDGILYLCGVEVTEVGELPEGFTSITLPPREYAVFTHHGHYSLLPKTFDNIWSHWAPSASGIAHGEPSFERYTSDFDPVAGEGGTEIWIPLNPQK